MDTPGADGAAAAAALRHLLAEYDRQNRLAIDAVYAQFSPTLDDFYAEDLRLLFPAAPDADGDLRPEIVLSRTVPGHEPKSVRGGGAPFPLGRATALALAAVPGIALLLRVEQAGHSQGVRLLSASGDDVMALLPH